MNDIIEEIKKSWDQTLEDLKKLVRIPSVSFEGFPTVEVNRSAEAVASLLKERGLENIEILRIPGAHPYIYADWLHAAPGAPTVLLYAHHDVQPPGRNDVWLSSPFEPTLREGPGGMRLYGRGTADDKAGIVVHTAAISSWLKIRGTLPLNVKILIEGEEETGSSHLSTFLEKHKALLSADVLILTDTANFDCGIPAITVSLRGMIGLEVEVRALKKTVHSGMWGGPLPDPALALCQMLAGLRDTEGNIAVPEILKDVRPLTAEERQAFSALDFDEALFREQSGLINEAKVLTNGPSVWAQLWREPSLNINAIQASSRAQPANIVNDIAWAKITMRLAPDMKPDDVTRALKKYLKAHVPWGLEVDFREEEASPPWMLHQDARAQSAIAAARVAMKVGYDKELVLMGCGATIPFVAPFVNALEGAPALLIGVEDPYTNAHGENESVSVDDLRKACVSQTVLFQELARRASEVRR